jgi:probable rRNA maturation factor
MISINNLTTVDIDENAIKQLVEKVLQGENKQEIELSIAFIGQGRMRKLNKKYRGKNRVTDVLSFSGQKIGKQKFVTPLEKTEGLGEIVICLRELKKTSQREATSFEKELFFCLIHGVLHLLGYDHEKDEESKQKMEKKQQTYLLQNIKTLTG